MVVDTSVLVAILFGEPEADRFLSEMNKAPHILLSAASLLEAGIVLLRQGDADVVQDLDRLIERAGIVVIPVDETQAVLARDGYRRFGKGMHRARLNFGDCFSYALAMSVGESLLFKGEDFGRTDVLVA
jgi:ribonuclease VapC